jgi:hypothetical protein
MQDNNLVPKGGQPASRHAALSRDTA